MNNTTIETVPAKRALLIETILSVFAILAISFLPTLHLYVSNASDLTLGSLMSSVYLFVGIGMVLFVVLRLLLRKHPFMAGCLSAFITFLIVNFSLISAPFKLFIFNYAIANGVALLFMLLLIAGAWFLLRRLCTDVQIGRGILTVFTIVFVGLNAFNGLQLVFSRPSTTTSSKQTAAEAEKPFVADLTPIPTIAPTVYITLTSKEDPFTPEPGASPVPVTATPTPTATPAPSPTPFKMGEPNIYLLLFDEYASMGAMEKYYDYNCDAMRTFMRAAGINWSEHSYSMTNETKYSMTDLNMMDFVSYPKSLSVLKSMRQKSKIKEVFGKKLGYELYQYSQNSTWFGYMTSLQNSTNRTKYQQTTMDGVESDNIVKDQSILGAFESILGALTPQSKITGDSESLQKYGYYSTAEITSSYAFKQNTYRSDAKHVLEILDFYEDANNFKGSQKRAIFSYIKCPHVPFFFDQYGQIRAFKQRMNWNNASLYRDQYIFITKHIVNIFKTIISTDPNSIIIVLSDHGVREHGQGFTTITPKDNCWTFLAVYYCGQPLDVEGMSSVNLMRHIATDLGVDMPPVRDYVTVDSPDDLAGVYSR